MQRALWTTIVPWVFLTLFLPAETPPGIVFDVSVIGRDGRIETREQSEITWFDGRWMERSDDSAVIIDQKAGRICLVDHAGKVWTGGDAESFLKELEASFRQDAAVLRETSPPAKPVPGPGAGGARPKVRAALAGTDTVDGAHCRHYKVLAGADLKEEVWVNTAIAPSAYFDVTGLQPLLERLETVTQTVSDAFRSPEESRTEAAIRAERAKLFPLGLEMRSLEHARGGVRYEKRVTNIRSFYGDASVFNVPEGYRKVSVREFIETTTPNPVDFSDPDETEKH
ncbi:MAG: hypothetical protein KA419_00375 [Acidobacteria bacterium]|nr:hypothetical protein [Acidobacteriota bacterium]